MKLLFIAAAGLVVAFPAWAQTRTAPSSGPSAGTYGNSAVSPGSTTRPSSQSNGIGTGTSGSSTGAATSTYPAPLRDFNSPSVSGGTSNGAMSNPAGPGTGLKR